MAWLSSHLHPPMKSTKSREIAVNSPMLIFFSSETKIGEKAAGEKIGRGQETTEKSDGRER